jgi:hypothetical protein
VDVLCEPFCIFAYSVSFISPPGTFQTPNQLSLQRFGARLATNKKLAP